MTTLTLDVRDLKRQMEEVRERRQGMLQIHDDVRELAGTMKELAATVARHERALFEEDERESGTGLVGLVSLAREAVIGMRWGKRIALAIGTVLATCAGLIATLIGMLYKLVESGTLTKLLP